MLKLSDTLQEAWAERDVYDVLSTLEGQVYRQKEGRRTFRFELEGRGYFAKVFMGIGWKALLACLLKFRKPVLSAENEWRAIQTLPKIGIPTMRLAGYGKRGRHPVHGQSFIITEELHPTVSLEDFCRNWKTQPPPPSLKQLLIERVAQIARTLHANRIVHRDLYLCHFLLDTSGAIDTDDGESLRLYLIDLHRARAVLRLPRARAEDDIPARARDWAEVRPEWALAGCKAFIAAPRSRTTGRSLEGRAFLHDYDWQQDADNGFGVLELIMTAPVVVASWISLQYYGSTVAPAAFGSGNKLLHNVVGGIGVFEGNGGLLRAGLPWQSVHDGEDYVHEPLRLSVCIEAPRDAMNEVLRRHEGVRELFDNRWLHLFAVDDDGRLGHRYVGDLQWEPLESYAEDDSAREVA